MKYYQTSLRKLVILMVISLVALIIIHQASYINDFTLASSSSESIEVIKKCRLSDYETPTDTKSPIIPKIPNLVHQIWKTDDVRTYSIEASQESWKASFEPLNFTVKLWTEDDVLKLIKADYSWLLSTYEGYSQNIQRADVARLVVVHAEGGTYADLDVYPILADKITCLQHIGLQAIFPTMTGNHGLSNHFFMAEKGSDFIEWALQEVKRRGDRSKRVLSPYVRVFWSTGPLMVTSASQQFLWMYNTASHKLGVLDEQYRRLVIRHKAGRSWHGPDGQVLNWFADHVDMQIIGLVVGLLAASLVVGCIIVRRRRGRGNLLYIES
jgi:mannosyltransferase OCH1-like enzyme